MGDPSINPGQLLTGPLFNEPMRVETVHQGGDGTWVLKPRTVAEVRILTS